MVVFLGILVKSKWRFILGPLGIFVAIIGFSSLSPDMQDRYLSTFGKGEKNQSTADERAEGSKEQFLIALRRPIFGHGLGTSPEANFNFSVAGPYAGRDLPAHNLFLEIAQELGLVGLVVFLLLMKSIVSSFAQARRANAYREAGSYMPRLIDALQVWLMLNLVFAFASYGLSSYCWYLLGGFAVVMQRLAIDIPLPVKADRKTFSSRDHFGAKVIP
jgi:O-antigen ligase